MTEFPSQETSAILNTIGVPLPVVNYVGLIKGRKPPYWDIVDFLIKDATRIYEKNGRTETVYNINPRVLQDEIEKFVNDEKLTSINVCRTLLALGHGVKYCEDGNKSMQEKGDFWTTTTSSGRRNYHLRVNKRTMGCLPRLL